MDNSEIYNSEKVVSAYALKKEALSRPEQLILDIIKIAGYSSMLDIGVGTGRTTKFFADCFENYFATDQSDKMIRFCENRFGETNHRKFQVCDARKMECFQTSSFDFIFFSFNGIDCVNHEGRIEILKEIHRLLNPNGKFAFSSHNLFNIPRLFSIQFPKNPLNFIPEIRRWKQINKENPSVSELYGLNYAIIKDGDLDFSTKYYYIHPAYQILQLKETGFNKIRILSLDSGKELLENTFWKNIKDKWLYYICEK